MASNTVTRPADTGPLSFMTKISPRVYHFRPPPLDAPPPPTSGPAPPKLILVASWLAARDLHIAKYIRPYRALYPSAEILLIRNSMYDFLRPRYTSAWLDDFAVPIIRAAFPEGTEPADTKTPQMLVHVFSGGGSFIMARLRALLAPSMPPHTIVFDSAPPLFHYRGSYLAVVGGWSSTMRNLLWPIVHLLCMYSWFTHCVVDRRRGGPLGRIAALHNERDKRAATEIRRAYIYGPGDELIQWQHAEWHALDAEKKGFDVRLEKFEGSAHVQHVRVDEKRYWRIVRETWEGR